MKDGTETLLYVTGDVKKDGYVKITKIIGEILSKDKIIGKTKEYTNKRGFDSERFAVITEGLGKNAKKTDTVIEKIFFAITAPSVDYNA